jgi:hypothetical protein
MGKPKEQEGKEKDYERARYVSHFNIDKNST